MKRSIANRGIQITLLLISICGISACGPVQPNQPQTGGQQNGQQPNTQPAPIAGNSEQNNPQGNSAQGNNNGPIWTRGNCNQHFKNGPKVICGVGVASNIKNPNLARQAAQGRGRTEIARVLDLRVEAVLRDYSSATEGTKTNSPKKGEDNQSNSKSETTDFTENKQVIEDISKQITQVSLPGTYMADSWTAPDGSLYALMVLEMGAFQSALQGSTVSVEYRDAVIARADKLFSDLDEEAGWN